VRVPEPRSPGPFADSGPRTCHVASRPGPAAPGTSAWGVLARGAEADRGARAGTGAKMGARGRAGSASTARVRAAETQILESPALRSARGVGSGALRLLSETKTNTESDTTTASAQAPPAETSAPEAAAGGTAAALGPALAPRAVGWDPNREDSDQTVSGPPLAGRGGGGGGHGYWQGACTLRPTHR